MSSKGKVSNAGAVSIPVQIDRLVSASSATDAESSLRGLISAVSNDASSSSSVEAADSIVSSVDCTTAICSLIGTNRIGSMDVDDGGSLSCELLLALLETSKGSVKPLLTSPSDGTLLSSLLDLLCSTTASSYPRILAMRLLRKFVSLAPSLTQTQLLAAPDGLNRLVDLLDPTTPEEIRNEGILLSTDLAKASSASARLIIFSEGYEKALGIATTEGGLTGGSVVVQDCLSLCLELSKNDEMGSEILLGSRGCLDVLGGMLDLRRGTKFLKPDEPEEEKVGDGDDLDAILKGAESTKPKKVIVPYLTEKEESLLSLILNILEVALTSEDDANDNEPGSSASQRKVQSRQKTILSHPLLSGLLIELALYGHPPPPSPYPSAVPSPSLQSFGLRLMSLLCQNSTPETQKFMLDGGRLERFMYLICTGGLTPSHPPEDKLMLSAHALSVLRCGLDKDSASLMVLHALAPPPVEEGMDPAAPREVPTVQKLVNTVSENLHFFSHDTEGKIKAEDRERMAINVIGAAGALGVLLTNGAGETTKEMLLRIPVVLPPLDEKGPPQSGTLMGCALSYLETYSTTPEDGHMNGKIMVALLRLLSEWMPDTTAVLEALFHSSGSIALGTLLSLKSAKDGEVATLTGLLLGLAMETMDPAKEYGGWSRDSVMGMISKMGVSRYTNLLEKMKARLNKTEDEQETSSWPWGRCQMERAIFAKWYSGSVSTVRRRVVSELTGTSSLSDEADESEAEEESEGSGDAGKSVKALNKLLASQAAEMEALRQSLAEAESTVLNQSRQLKVWKRRVESTPTQLDEMLSDYTKKTDELEEKNKQLQKEMDQREAEFDKKLKEKDDEIGRIQRERDESRERESEARHERDSLREEMVALSTAYSNLEVEYHRVVGEGGRTGMRTEAAAPTAEGSGEGSGPGGGSAAGGFAAGEQPEGEVSHQQTTTGSTRAADETTEQQGQQLRQAASDARGDGEEEVLSTLRAENERLRSDVRAADEWMSMAVGRMEEMTAQIGVLQGQVAAQQQHAVRGANDGAVSPSDGGGAAASVHVAEREVLEREVGRLREDLTRAGAALTESQDEASKKLNEMRRELDFTTEEVQRVRDELGRCQERERDLEREKQQKEETAGTALAESQAAREDAGAKLSAMQRELDGAREEIRTVREGQQEEERRRRYEEREEKTPAVATELPSQLPAEKDTILSPKSAELTNLQKKMETMCESYEQDIRKKEGELAVLQDAMTKLELEVEKGKAEMEKATKAKEEEIQRRDGIIQDIEKRLQQQQVRESDDEGRKKMEEEIQSLRSANEAAQDWMGKAVEHHSALSNQVADLTTKNAALGSELDALKTSSVTDGTTAEKARDNLTAQIANLTTQNASLTSELESARTTQRRSEETSAAQIANLQQQKVALTSELDALHSNGAVQRRRADEAAAAAQKAEDTATAMETTVTELTRARDSISTQIDTMRRELEAKEHAVAEAQKEARESQLLVDELESKKVELEAKNGELYAVRGELTALQSSSAAEVAKLNGDLVKANEEVARLRSEVDGRRIEADRLAEELTSVRTQFDRDAASFRDENASLTRQCEEHRADADRVQSEIGSVRTAHAELSAERDGHVTTINDLTSKLTNFQSWTSTAQERIAELESDRDGAEERAESLAQSESRLREELENNRRQLHEVQGRLAEVEKERKDVDGMVNQVNQLRSMVDSLENEKKNLLGKNQSLEEKTKQLEELEGQIFDKDDALAEADGEVASLRKEMDDIRKESEDVVRQWRERAEELESNASNLESQMEQQQAEANEAIAQWEARCAALEQEVQTVIDSKDELERTLAATNEQLSSIEATMHAEIVTKQTEVESVKNQLLAERNARAADEADRFVLQENLDKKVEGLEGTVKEQRETIEDLRAQVEERDDAAASAEDEVEALAKEMAEMRAQSEEVVNQWRERTEELESNVAELEDTVADLENTVEEQQDAANEAIAQWETQCNALTDQIAEMEQLEKEEWSEEKASLISKLKEYEVANAQKQAAYVETTAQADATKAELVESTEMRDQLVKELKDARSQLQATQEQSSTQLASMRADFAALQSSRDQLLQNFEGHQAKEAQQQHATRELEVVISAEKKARLDAETKLSLASESRSQAETTVERLQQDYDAQRAHLLSKEQVARDLEEALAVEKGAKLEAEKCFAMELESRSKAEAALEEYKAQSEKALGNYKILLEKKLDEGQEQMRRLEDEQRAAEEKNSVLEEEATEMREIIGQLQEELQEANDALSLRLTDEISEKATEIATEALRRQISDMRAQYSAEREAFVNEQRARLQAEKEAERLKSDLALLASTNEQGEHVDGHIVKLTSELQRKERQEMEELRASLDRIMEELNAARASERDAEERAANSRLHASVCEREVMAAKSDLAFLTQAMEEMRDSEMGARSSLEYRINALEDDREILLRTHANDVDSLKNELAQVNMEKERLVHSLADSEKANAALVYSTSIDNDRSGGSQEQTELAKLRLEKAQLLAAAAKGGSKTERRIREAVATQASSSEADLILERELRETAEGALDDMQVQMDEMKSRLNASDGGAEGSSEQTDDAAASPTKRMQLDDLERELERLKTETEKLKGENKVLRKQWEQAEADAKTSMTKLTEKCRLAEARARELERDGHFEAAVAAEVARLRAESSGKNNSFDFVMVDDKGPLGGEGKYDPMENSMSADELFEVVLEQKAAVKEERLLYRDLLEEHEDLLALLAQQDLERASLQSSLAEVAGREAVDKAIRLAEENAVEQFGKYVRLR